MLVFCEKLYDGPLNDSVPQYTPENTWAMVGKVDQLFLQARGGQASASTSIKVDIETSNDGQAWQFKTVGALTVTLGSSTTVNTAFAVDTGTNPNGCFVRFKLYAGTASTSCWGQLWVSGRTL